jgi:hypothetical protein
MLNLDLHLGGVKEKGTSEGSGGRVQGSGTVRKQETGDR